MTPPVLLLAWRRPNTLRRVIDAIRPAAPSRLFVACDGPNGARVGEADKVAATRELIEKAVDWPCQIERLYSDTNLGCRDGPVTAISWFFEQVEEGVILEDDCVPHPDFLPYCSQLLDYYRDDSRVWCITGDNATGIKLASSDYSYGFIRYPLIWGWATWRRCWHRYLPAFDHIQEISENRSYILELFNSNEELAHSRISYWMNIKTTNNRTIWDAAWAYTCLVNSGLTILPSVNLVSNIGFGFDSTHTLLKGKGGVREAADTRPILPLSHPPFVIRDSMAEISFEETIYGNSSNPNRVSVGKLFKNLSNVGILLKRAIRSQLYIP